MPIAHSAGATEDKPTTGVAATAPEVHAGLSPAVEHILRSGHPIVLGLLWLFAVIELSLAASLAAQSPAVTPNFVYYILFVSVWTILLAPAYIFLFRRSPNGSPATSVLSHLVFIGLTWVFWLAAAAKITDGSLDDCSSYTELEGYCHRFNATIGITWVTWIMSLFALIGVLLGAVQASRRGDGLGGGFVSA